MNGPEILRATIEAGETQSGLVAERVEDGKVDLRCEDDGTGARCLICRSGVTGWLRVYT